MDNLPSSHTPDLRVFFKALGNETRFKIFDLLMTGSQCNCELAKALDMPLNLISHHIHILLDLGLVSAKRNKDDARWIFYSINQQVLAELNRSFIKFTDPSKIKDRIPACPIIVEK